MEDVISAITAIMLIAGLIGVLVTFWLGTRVLKRNSANEEDYGSRLRRSLYLFSVWAGMGLLAVATFNLLTFPRPIPDWFWWSFLPSFVGAYALLLIACACFYALAKRY
jgi:hypothetical protein